MKRTLTIFAAIMLSAFHTNAQTCTWSGKLDIQGTELSIVFHLDSDKPTMDSPDQGAELLGCSGTDSNAVYEAFP